MLSYSMLTCIRKSWTKKHGSARRMNFGSAAIRSLAWPQAALPLVTGRQPKRYVDRLRTRREKPQRRVEIDCTKPRPPQLFGKMPPQYAASSSAVQDSMIDSLHAMIEPCYRNIAAPPVRNDLCLISVDISTRCCGPLSPFFFTHTHSLPLSFLSPLFPSRISFFPLLANAHLATESGTPDQAWRYYRAM